MLSRSAQGLYWMGRYLERTAHLCHLLRFQVESLVDRPIREIYFGWSRVYASLNRRPPGDTLELGEGDDYTLADSYTLAGDLTFEHSDSILGCFSLVRENARQMRHCISGEMWMCLNLSWLRIRDLGIEDIWKVSPENFYIQTMREIDTFTGVTETSMYHDEGWHFIRLGRFVEHAQLLIALLLAQFAVSREQSKTFTTDWAGLLRICQAFQAYQRRYGTEILPKYTLSLLVTDPLLPGSLCRSLGMIEKEINAIGKGPSLRTSIEVKNLAERLNTLIQYEWSDRDDSETLLTWVRERCYSLHDIVTATYIDYAIESSPPR